MDRLVLDQLFKGATSQVGEVDSSIDAYVKNVLRTKLNKYTAYSLCILYKRLRKRRKNFNRVELVEYILKTIDRYNIADELTWGELTPLKKEILASLTRDFYLTESMQRNFSLYDFKQIANFIKGEKPLTIIQRIKRYNKYFNIKQ